MAVRTRTLLAAAAGIAALASQTQGRVSPRDVAAVWHKLPRPRLAVAATQAAPKVDGRIGEAEWRSASVAGDFLGTDSPRWRGTAGLDHPAAGTTVRVTYDATSLYVAFRCEEPEIETLQVTGEKQRDGALWRDDCVELFLAPPGGKGRYHFIVNSRGWVYDAKNAPTVRRGSDWNCGALRVAAAVSPPGKGSHWTVELAVPFAALGAAAPGRGEVWGINFARERYAASYKALIEYSTWSGLVGGFEQPEMFGEICFTDIRQNIRLPRPFLGANALAGELTAMGGGRKVNVKAFTASAARAAEAGTRTIALPAATPAPVALRATVTGEGAQVLAMVVTDEKTGAVLSCTRAAFHVPDVLTSAARVRARLEALAAKAGSATRFAAGIGRQRRKLEALAAKAKEVRKHLADAQADADARARWADLREQVGKIEAAATFVVWTCSPYIATGPSSMPPGLTGPATLRIAAAQNEYEHVAINVTNLTGEAIEFQLDGALPGQVSRARSGLDTTVQKLVAYQPKLLGKKINDLPEKEDGLAMPLVELNGLSTFFVQPFATRQIWITVQTRDVKPGTRTGRLRLVPLSVPLPAVAIPWEMTVWKLRIEEDAPIGVFCFDYAGDFEWMKSYKINLWFRGAFPHKLELAQDGTLKPYKTDIDRVTRRRSEGARKFLFSYGYSGSFIQWAEKNKVEYMSDRFKGLFKQVLSRMVTEWLAAGLKHEDFALQSIDEAHGRGVQQVIDTTPLIREVDPKVRVAMTIMTGLDDLKRMAPHVDVWVNRNGAIWGREQDEFFAAERARGKPLWSWNMPCTPKSKPITQFRTYGWRAMKFDFDAIGFFLYFGLVYQPQRPGGGFATRHWEAWRDGVEDYQVLRLLREEIDRAGERGVEKDKLDAARELLAKVVDDVISESFFPANTQETHDRIEAARRRVADEVLRIRTLKK